MTTPGDEIGKFLHQMLAAGEELIDGSRRALSRKLGTNQVGHLESYGGYSDLHGTHLLGRVLEKAPEGGPMDHDGIWQNLANTFRRWESDEVPGAEVRLSFEGHEATTLSDEEGYYQTTLPRAGEQATLWSRARAHSLSGSSEIATDHEVLVVPRSAAFGVISDLDDTVIHSGITSILLAAKLTFLENSRTRKPLDGVSEFYTALQQGNGTVPSNPIFYVSSSPWNLHGLLADFMALNRIPKGPMLLRDLGLDRTKFLKERGHGHKLEKALRLLAGFPELPFVLIGDSGQEDASIYARLCELHPDRIKAVYIRDVDPGQETGRDAAVLRSAAKVEALGIPMVLARDSNAMALHAGRMGLIPEMAVPEVAEDVREDKSLPGTGEQAVNDAVDALVRNG